MQIFIITEADGSTRLTLESLGANPVIVAAMEINFDLNRTSSSGLAFALKDEAHRAPCFVSCVSSITSVNQQKLWKLRLGRQEFIM